MKIKPIIYGVLVISVFFGTILGFQSAGLWSTSGKFDRSGQAIQPSSSDPTTIKGWMTLEQVVTIYNVPLSEIINQFSLPSDTLITTPLKDLESDSFETSTLIEWLQNREGNSSSMVSPTSLVEKSNVNEEIIENLSITPTPEQITQEQITLEPTEHSQPEKMITGKTTFQDVIDWGVSIEIIQKTIDGEIPDNNKVIKDFAVDQGIPFSELKTQLQLEIDKLDN